jgi:hypothetical protein
MRSLLFEDSVCMKSSTKVLVVELLISVIHKHPADHTPFHKKRHHCPYYALCDFLMFKRKVKKYQAGIDAQKIKQRQSKGELLSKLSRVVLFK